MTTDPTPTGCTDPCIACMTDESHDPAVPVPVETSEQRADLEETEREHAAGDHTHCGITCEAELPTEHLRNFVIAKGYPGTKGALDELLRRERAAAVPSAGGGLRDRIAEALYAHIGFAARYLDLDQDQRDAYLARADAVLAVLPATADRAAVPREAAGLISESEYLRSYTDDHMRDIHEAADVLRRMADEAQPEAHPALTEFSIEILDADMWTPISFKRATIEDARRARDGFRRRFPEAPLRIVRWAETSTVVETDEAQQADVPVVAYRAHDSGSLYCAECCDGLGSLAPLSSEDLPDGGLCTSCGVDVLLFAPSVLDEE